MHLKKSFNPFVFTSYVLLSKNYLVETQENENASSEKYFSNVRQCSKLITDGTVATLRRYFVSTSKLELCIESKYHKVRLF